MRQDFQRLRALSVPDILEHQLLRQVQSVLATTEFSPRTLPALGRQDVGQQDRASGILNFVLARPALYRWLEQVTGCGPIGGIDGSVMRLRRGQYLDWHDDMNDQRRAVAITICLSDTPYDGGQFQIRRKESASLLFSHLHKASGTALVFDIGRTLEHRVTEIVSGEARTVYSGWFLKAASP